MNVGEFQRFDAIGLAELIRDGAVSAAEVRAASLALIAECNPQINAVIELFDDEPPSLPGPFHGVPFLIKDFMAHRAGGLLEMGSRLGLGLRTPHDTVLIERFRAAGLTLLGRTNTPEFAYACTTEPIATGPTRNPWNLTRTAGGSSGGSGAAVGARLVPMAHGNDGAGSLRNPAANCGIFAMKSSRGRISLAPDAGQPAFGFPVEGVLSRSVRDSAAMLDLISGPAPGEPFVIAAPTRPYLHELDRAAPRLRMAFTTEAWSGVPISDVCKQAVSRAASLCEELGHSVEEARPSFDYELFRSVKIRGVAAGMLSMIDDLVARTGRKPSLETLEAATLATYLRGQELTVRDVINIPAAINTMCRSIAPFFEKFDVLITPTTATPAPPLGTYDQNKAGVTVEQWFDHKGSFVPFLALFNMTGQPAMSVPLFESNERLPIGIQFAGRFGREDQLFQLAGQLERARPWIARRPRLAPAGINEI